MSLEILGKHLKNANLIKHCVATGAAMRALAGHFGEDAALWERAGILHDIDLDITKGDMSVHGLTGAEILRAEGECDALVDAVLAHAGKKEAVSLMERALFAVDPLTGLIVSATLVLPSKKIADLTVESVMKRFREKRFAAGARREDIALCEGWLGLPLEGFVGIVLSAMQGVAGEIGL